MKRKVSVVNNREKAYAEVIDIINHLSKKEYQKIPKEVIQNLTQKMDCKYKTNFNFTLPLDEQEMLYETKVILQLIHENYLAMDKEKRIIQKKKDAFLGKVCQ